MKSFTENESPVGIEKLWLDWIRTISIFLLVGISLYHFTPYGKYFSLVSLIITIFLISCWIFDYYITNKNEDIDHRPIMDLLIVGMLVALGLIVWITYTVYVLPPPHILDPMDRAEISHIP